MKTVYDSDQKKDENIDDILKDEDEIREDIENIEAIKEAKKPPTLPSNKENDDEILDKEEQEMSEEAQAKVKISKEKFQEFQQKGLTAIIEIVASVGIRVRKIPEEDQTEWKTNFHEMADGISFLIAGDEIGEFLGSFAKKTKPITKVTILIGFLVLMIFVTPTSSHTLQAASISPQQNSTEQSKASNPQQIPVLNVGRFSIYGGGK